MKAIILAAGSGTRLKKYTQNLPKCMLLFNGKTIIERQIETFRSCGIDNIVVVRGFASDKIQYSGVKYYNNINYATTNMVESLLVASPEFNDDIIVSYSDVLFESQMLSTMMLSSSDFACAVDDNWKFYWKKRYGTVDFDTESLVINENGNIVELGLENPPIEQISARYIGLLKFSKNGLYYIKQIMNDAYRSFENLPWQQSGNPVRRAYMTDLLNAIIQSGKDVKAIHFNNGWIEFDTNEDYENAVEWVNNGTLNDIINI